MNNCHLRLSVLFPLKVLVFGYTTIHPPLVGLVLVFDPTSGIRALFSSLDFNRSRVFAMANKFTTKPHVFDGLDFSYWCDKMQSYIGAGYLQVPLTLHSTPANSST
jgi:hypothetical protein